MQNFIDFDFSKKSPSWLKVFLMMRGSHKFNSHILVLAGFFGLFLIMFGLLLLLFFDYFFRAQSDAKQSEQQGLKPQQPWKQKELCREKQRFQQTALMKILPIFNPF